MDTSGHYRIDTTADYRIRVNQAMRYMHAHVEDQLSLDEIAAQACFSPFHFHRVFRRLTGEPVGVYLTRTRMIKAASLLEQGFSVADAGAAVGYRSISAFIKGFKRVFGTLPARRPGSRPLLIPSTTSASYFPRPELRPEIRALPALPLLYVTKQGIIEEFFDAGQAYAILDNCLHEIGLEDRIQCRLGVLRNTTQPDTRQWRFDACVVPDSMGSCALPAPMKQGVIQAGLWAVFPHVGAYDTLWQTWNLAYKAWLPNSTAQLRDAPPFEVYLSNKRTTSPEKLRTEIYLPVTFP